mmetsp:Transcript_13601/g.36789  ORF Transcript_13601/g.36789 Transcript_13601/m.36789 type:complete len:391 (+) Transcript_13601:273-1445(+)|eukprot:CAMPEP_0202358772 /NCGR_PEP_ID=MMETSP1126-20121109/12320_1 /ASSEMBLY_ACC=CAM_ASM_000457 /TAXON_ID=3047 /ORGANISM="Dunaliella tertiolecta, Strain CCMP1320" /LENGTH=390 /DNA_ID=CAMNT_0048952029 /DNA_START=218 /DNA_END=1390 /DNA_ORIENTATION=-
MAPLFHSKRVPEPGYFLVIDNWKKQAAADGRDVIDLSVGASDLPPPKEALEELRAASHDPGTYSYCLKNKTMPLLEAACAWFKRRYNVPLDPSSEALSLVGSQEGLAHLLLATTDPGDSVLMLDVAYPSYWGALKIAGVKPVFLPLSADGLPDFCRVPAADAASCKVVLLNYPNNPTTTTADDSFFERTINFCKHHGLLLIHDNPYVDQVYSGRASSPLALPGGRDVCVELFSFAKSFHLAGFRLGFALGNASAIAALESVKSPVDFNQYLGIQRMGIVCLNLPDERVKADAQIWHERAARLVSKLGDVGWELSMPKSGMYLWGRLPPGCGTDDLSFCQSLVASEGVALSPGRGFGPGGFGHVRFALVAPVDRLEDAAARIGRFIAQQNK